MLNSCITTEIIGESLQVEVDSVKIKNFHKPLPPRDISDTTRVPIGFNPSVEDWDETIINN